MQLGPSNTLRGLTSTKVFHTASRCCVSVPCQWPWRRGGQPGLVLGELRRRRRHPLVPPAPGEGVEDLPAGLPQTQEEDQEGRRVCTAVAPTQLRTTHCVLIDDDVLDSIWILSLACRPAGSLVSPGQSRWTLVRYVLPSDLFYLRLTCILSNVVSNTEKIEILLSGSLRPN